MGEAPRTYLSRLSKKTGDGLSWILCAHECGVADLQLHGDTVLVGGSFTEIGGQPRSYLAALDAATADPTPWNPAPDSFVYNLAMHGDTLFVDGNFTEIGGQPRNGLAAIDAVTGLVTAWNPDVRVLALSRMSATADRVFVLTAGECGPVSCLAIAAIRYSP